MARHIIQMNDSNGDAVYPIAPCLFDASNANTWEYTGFARLPKTNTINYGTLLVSGYDNISASVTLGASILQVRQNSSQAITLTATKIAPNGSANVRFGYWDGGDGYWYIGVYTPAYRARLAVLPLTIHSNSARRLTIGEYYPSSSTAPTGWTSVNFTSV